MSIYVAYWMEVLQHACVIADPFSTETNLGYTIWPLMSKHFTALALRCMTSALHPCLLRLRQIQRKMLE